MSAKQRLQELRSTLEGRGVRAVALCLSPAAYALPLSQLEAGAVAFLDAYVAGEYEVVQFRDRFTDTIAPKAAT